MNSNGSRLPVLNYGSKRSLTFPQILTCCVLMLASFYSGLLLGMQSTDSKCQECLQDYSSIQRAVEKAKQEMMGALREDTKDLEQIKADILTAINENRVDKNDILQAIGANKVNERTMQTLKQDLLKAIHEAPVVDTANTDEKENVSLIPQNMSSLFAGMARVDRDEFFRHFDVGVPKDPSTLGNQEVLLLYSKSKSLPENVKSEMPLLSAEDATRHCNTLKVVFTEHNAQQECLALVGQWESYHVHKFMRLAEKNGINEKLPLRYVSRLHIDSGLAQRVPTPPKVKEYNEMMARYLLSLDDVLRELAPIASKAGGRDNTIVVMVCNHGQSELLINFVCSSRARGLHLSHVLVFATDVETKELAEALGLVAFYDHLNFQSMPKKAAGGYADKTFTEMMMAKVYCVHMISQLAYDLLFQDVDTVWYRNPLEFFSNRTNGYYDYDIYFQDDGARSVRYQPFSPNSGFYFARHNERTEYFFHSLLMSGPIIAQSGSHQNAMAAVLQDHASWRGLHVKTLNRDMEEFPNGYHYQKDRQLMKNIVEGKAKPYVFHMSWTSNKKDKVLFMQQMGDWFVKEECVGGTVNSILNETVKDASAKTDISGACCMAKPNIKCHYRDRPSKKDCKDAPPMVKGGPSWWG